MRAAIREAAKGQGSTHPNPAVGAVVAKNGRVLSRGWHAGAGHPHAETVALNQAGSKSRGATLYVTLEPCSTWGRTPPCTQTIAGSGIARLVYGALDPNPRHSGRADAILSESGIMVTRGVLAGECSGLNTSWNKWIATGLPYVIAKAAMTLDGRIDSPPGGRWISCAASRRDAMILRNSVHAILIGAETLRRDNPSLTVRGLKCLVQPWRVVWTRSGRLPGNAKLFTDKHAHRTIVARHRSLSSLLRALGRRGAASVLIEGGGFVLGEAFARGLVDEVRFYLAPLITGGFTPAVGGSGVRRLEDALRLSDVVFRRIESDVVLCARVAAAPSLK